MKEYLLVPDMMQLLQCSRRTIYREMEHGRVPKPFKLCRNKCAWHKDDVKKILEERRAAANAGK